MMSAAATAEFLSARRFDEADREIVERVIDHGAYDSLDDLWGAICDHNLFDCESRCGWISRSGLFYGCGWGKHEIMLVYMGLEVLGWQHKANAENAGWVRVSAHPASTSAPRVQCLYRLSVAQRRCLSSRGWPIPDRIDIMNYEQPIPNFYPQYENRTAQPSPP
jgi:hypothetical protein